MATGYHQLPLHLVGPVEKMVYNVDELKHTYKNVFPVLHVSNAAPPFLWNVESLPTKAAVEC